MTIFQGEKPIKAISKEDQSILEQIEELKEVDVGRTGTVKAWKLNKMTMDSNGWWELIVDFIESFHDLGMGYMVSIVLDPTPYNENIKRIIEKFTAPQQSLFLGSETVIGEINKVRKQYEADMKMFGTFDFAASVTKFEVKSESKQVKFGIDSEAAKHFLERRSVLYKTALVLKKL